MIQKAPIPTPPSAGIGPEILGAPPIAPPTAKKLETVAGMSVGPEKKAEKISMGAPAEDPTLILGIMEEHAEEPPREILENVAAADLKPESATATQAENPTEATTPAPDATADTAALEKKRQEMKQLLEELGKVLLEAGDTRASLAAIGLSTGDTPMADEFRQEIVEMLLMGGKPKTVEETKWMEMQNKSSPVPHEDSKLRAFFERHKYPLDLIDQWGGELVGAQQILTLSEKGEYTPVAQDLQRAMGWGEKNPMPTSHEALAKQFGDNPEFANQMKGIMRTEKMTEMYALFNQIKGLSKEKGPNALHALLILASMLEGMIQQGTADAGSGNQGH
jgi:hypothetical protein